MNIEQMCYNHAHLNLTRRMVTTSKEILLEKERFELKPKSGGGLLSYEVWGFRNKGKTVVTRYSLAYINHTMHAGDNGRVLGFDNAHDYHHRHFMGKIEAVQFDTYEATLERFQKEWWATVQSVGGKKS
ncbi:MAG: DUF6516 family protein [Burkholderiales bacterium]